MSNGILLKFYKSTDWRRCRDAALLRDNYLCQDCLKDGKISTAYDVHHIKEINLFNVYNPDISLNLNNLVCLCHECHNKRHTRFEKQERQKERYTIDRNGNFIKID